MSLASFRLSGSQGLVSCTVLSPLTAYYHDQCVNVNEPFYTLSCIVQGRPVRDRCSLGNKFAPTETVELSLQKNRQLAYSCAYWTVELANSSRNSEVLGPGQDTALARTLRGAWTFFSLAAGRTSSPFLLRLQNTFPSASVDRATDVVYALVSTGNNLSPVFVLSGFEKISYRANVLSSDHPAQAASCIDPEHVRNLSITVRESRWGNAFDSFSVLEKHPSSYRVSVLPAAAEGKLAVPF